MGGVERVGLHGLGKWLASRENRILAAVVLLVVGGWIAFRFDYYYSLNDDMLMKDIVSGGYTGSPEGRNIQMLFPVSWFMSVFYRVAGGISWYGVFMVFCQFGALYVILSDGLGYFRTRWGRLLGAVVAGMAVCSLLLYNLEFVQYTVTAALLGGAAIFRLYASDGSLSWKSFVYRNLVSVIFVVAAFQIRTEILLLILPLICAAGVCKWSLEEKIFCGDSFRKYLTLIGLIGVGLAGSLLVDGVACGSPDWKEFNRFFDARTEVYDFEGIPPFEGNEEFYEELGLDRSAQELLLNYNFGLEDEIDGEMLEEMAEYGRGLREASPISTGGKWKEAVVGYVKIALTGLYGGEAPVVPWHLLLLLMYVCLMAGAAWGGDKSFFLKIPLLLLTRSVLWIYLVYRGRMVERVNTSLYLVEFLILLVMLLAFYREGERRVKRGSSWIYAGIFLVLCLPQVFCLGETVRRTQIEYDRREEVNTAYLSLLEYCKENPGEFYFLDVYSTVAYSEKLFTGEGNGLRNYDFLGGWANKSPLAKKKLQEFGMDSIQSGILSNKNVFVVSHVKRPIVWLEEYLAGVGIQAVSEAVDYIWDNGEEAFVVYQVKCEE